MSWMPSERAPGASSDLDPVYASGAATPTPVPASIPHALVHLQPPLCTAASTPAALGPLTDRQPVRLGPSGGPMLLADPLAHLVRPSMTTASRRLHEAVPWPSVAPRPSHPLSSRIEYSIAAGRSTGWAFAFHSPPVADRPLQGLAASPMCCCISDDVADMGLHPGRESRVTLSGTGVDLPSSRRRVGASAESGQSREDKRRTLPGSPRLQTGHPERHGSLALGASET